MSAIKSTLLFLLLLLQLSLRAQDITYAFENPQVTTAGPFGSFEVDIVASTTTPFKLGSGQLYLNYNTDAFGSSVVSNNRAVFTTTGTVLGQTSGPFPIYTSFISADNLPSRLSFSWQQALSEGCMSDNIGVTNSVVFHLRLDYISGGNTQSSGLCFESTALFDDQTFTACGPGSCTFPDCVANAGIQITNDAFDCSGSALPISLTYFDAQKMDEQSVLLQWESEQEVNSDYYLLERSRDARQWQAVQWVKAAGESTQALQYTYLDEELTPRSFTSLYYRLKMVDQDESFMYSPIRAVEFRQEADLIHIYPIPATEGVYVDLPEGNSFIRLRLLDSQGKLVYHEELQAHIPQYFIPFEPHFSQGIYWLLIENEKGTLFKQAVVLSR